MMASLLMVDHAPLFRLLESTCARRSGWSLRSATTAEDLLVKARAERPDVIVLSGPIGDAKAFASRLRADASLAAVPILAIGQGADLEAAARAGSGAAIAWPAAESDLEEPLARLMHETRRAWRRRAVRLAASLDAGEGMHRVWLRDIGPGGAFILKPGGPGVGTAVALEVRLPEAAAGREIRARGVVVRRVDEEAGSWRVPGLAVRFTDSDPDRTSRLESFVRAAPLPAPEA
ncbi:MAG TPA: PilZ domain-containing protein [Candidatus Polarisedimenticolia bacterium]|nr:PilZ domain-containing protein [Candidatus Polarisedimenticolia bacterium]